MNSLVSLKNKKTGHVHEFVFEHAYAILLRDKKYNTNTFEAVGNHQFIGNELIIKASDTDSTASTKPRQSTKRTKVRK